MGFSIRVMERKDVAAVGDLLAKVFGEKNPVFPNWPETLEWLYFSPEIKDQVPRALVIANEQSVVGHIGFSLSEFTDGDRSFTVVNTENWVVDPDHKPGLLSLRLMLEAASFGDVAIVLDGSLEAQRVIPGIGYKKRGKISRYIKIMKPWSFLCLARSRKQQVRHLGKLVVFLMSSLSGRFHRWLTTQEPVRPVSYRMVEVGGPGFKGALASGVGLSFPSHQKVLRNALRPEFVNWYQQCPQGNVRVLRFFDGEALVGQATLIIQSRKANSYATILNVDATTKDVSAWVHILAAIEDFLRDKQVAHINAIGTHEPWCQALRHQGYGKLKSMIFWLRDKSGRVADVQAWHLTAIEGDFGYLVE